MDLGVVRGSWCRLRVQLFSKHMVDFMQAIQHRLAVSMSRLKDWNVVDTSMIKSQFLQLVQSLTH